MQWILQDFEDTRKLATALDQLGFAYSWHKVVPFVGEIIPAPQIADPDAVILFGSYSLWRQAEAAGYWPGVFKIAPFVHETLWQPFMLNGPDALFLRLDQLGAHIADDGSLWFVRPVDDSKAMPGSIKSSGQILAQARKVLALDPQEIAGDALNHDTLLMLTRPAQILREWRVWIVDGQPVTWSLYKDGPDVVYRHQIDPDALDFAGDLARLNPGFSRAYVMDICRTDQGLRLLETNCLNAAGFYAADLVKLASAINALTRRDGDGA